MPGVSTNTNCFSPTKKLFFLFSTVTPCQFPTCSFAFVRLLKKVVFPAFGLPTSKTSSTIHLTTIRFKRFARTDKTAPRSCSKNTFFCKDVERIFTFSPIRKPSSKKRLETLSKSPSKATISHHFPTSALSKVFMPYFIFNLP